MNKRKYFAPGALVFIIIGFWVVFLLPDLADGASSNTGDEPVSAIATRTAQPWPSRLDIFGTQVASGIQAARGFFLGSFTATASRAPGAMSPTPLLNLTSTSQNTQLDSTATATRTPARTLTPARTAIRTQTLAPFATTTGTLAPTQVRTATAAHTSVPSTASTETAEPTGTTVPGDTPQPTDTSVPTLPPTDTEEPAPSDTPAAPTNTREAPTDRPTPTPKPAKPTPTHKPTNTPKPATDTSMPPSELPPSGTPIPARGVERSAANSEGGLTSGLLSLQGSSADITSLPAAMRAGESSRYCRSYPDSIYCRLIALLRQLAGG